MFGKKAQSILSCLGAEKDLVHNENLNEQVELLSLVKIHKPLLKQTIKYTFMEQTILDVLTDAEINPADLVRKDITILVNVTSCIENTKDNSAGVLADRGVSGNSTTQDSATSFTVKKDVVDLKKLKTLLAKKDEPVTKRTVKKEFQEDLKVRNMEKLAFVHQIFYNSSSVTLRSKASGNDSVKSLTVTAKKVRKEETQFTVPTDCTLAFGLMEVIVHTDEEHGTIIEIPSRMRIESRIYRSGPRFFPARFPVIKSRKEKKRKKENKAKHEVISDR